MPAAENPFTHLLASPLPPWPRLAATLRVQIALSGTIDHPAGRHAEELFDLLEEETVLAEDGGDAWREAALVLLQYLAHLSTCGTGPAAADRYTATQPPPDPRAPARTLTVEALAAWLRGARPAAATTLAAADDSTVAGAARWLYCIAAIQTGYPPARRAALIERLCAGSR